MAEYCSIDALAIRKRKRSEVISAAIDSHTAHYTYDYVGNCRTSIFDSSVTNNYLVNRLNQYTTQLRLSATPRETTFSYDADGNQLSDGIFAYTYDSKNRLKTVSSNSTIIVENFYDARSRRVRKVTTSATHTFFYDDWNLVEERIAYANGEASTIKYYWGKDLSGTMQGAGGIGGLLYLTIDRNIYIPCYDNNGNITKYLDSLGNVVAVLPSISVGAPFSITGSGIEFDNVPPEAFAGTVAYASAGIGAMAVPEVSWISLGNAREWGFSLAGGAEMGLGGGWGWYIDYEMTEE